MLALAGRKPTPAGVEPPLLAVDIKAGEESGALEQELVQLALGHGVLIADVIALFASLDIVAPELDR